MVDRPSPQDGPAPRRGDPGVRPYRFRMDDARKEREAANARAREAEEARQQADADPDRQRVERIAEAMRRLAPNLSEAMATSYAYEALHPADEGLPTTEELGRWVQDEIPVPTTARVPEARVRQQAAERRAVEIAEANQPRPGDYAGQGHAMRAD